MGSGTAERLRSERARVEREMEGRSRDRKGPVEWKAEQDSSRANGRHLGTRGIPAGVGTPLCPLGKGERQCQIPPVSCPR